MSEKLEVGMNDTVHQKLNVVDTNFMQLYLPEDSYYDKAANLAAYMGERNVDMIQLVLECNQALGDGKPRPKLR